MSMNRVAECDDFFETGVSRGDDTPESRSVSSAVSVMNTKNLLGFDWLRKMF
jgi:hypothetical protein